MGVQAIGRVTKSTEDKSGLNFPSSVPSTSKDKSDPRPRSSRAVLLSPMYSHAGQVRSYRGARRLDWKSYNTIINVKPWRVRYLILSITGSKTLCSFGISSQPLCLLVGASVGSIRRSWASACTIAQSSLQWSHLPGRDVRDQALGPKLEVVGVDQARILPGPLQHMEQPGQADQRTHVDKYLTKVDKDRHQYERMWQQVLKLELVQLKQSEKEGRHRRHKPNHGVAGEEDELSQLKVVEREGAALHPPIVPR
jgi:hypothetical protein